VLNPPLVFRLGVKQDDYYPLYYECIREELLDEVIADELSASTIPHNHSRHTR
jgi:hypothetical protein